MIVEVTCLLSRQCIIVDEHFIDQLSERLPATLVIANGKNVRYKEI